MSSGAAQINLTATSTARLLIPSLREAEVGREYEGYTITRMLLNLSLLATTGDEQVVTAGLITHNEDINISQIDPATNPFADWMWHEEFVIANNNNAYHFNIQRDIRSQRKTRGAQSDTFLYLFNRGAVTILFHISGRVLCKRA